MSEQLSLFNTGADDGELLDLIRLLWRCVQVSPLVPPALRDECRRRICELGIEVER